ncbi:type 2 lanthipeptide synthetase LanM family protein [Amycolatopsis pigmentata]|uniref:Type 2 lanthipeptide synthetase LanM family protein n=1 Tax=Amycolatopsis pigmentata TaxID=450801 RepID=A0ABW5G487_9PSEU
MTDASTPDLGEWWWAPALTVNERLPAPGGPEATGRRRASERLEHWRSAHRSHDNRWFADRLASAGLDEVGLLALLAEPSEALAARVPQPGWARSVHRTLTEAKSDPPEMPPPADWRDAFAVPFRPFVESARTRLLRRTGDLPGAEHIDLTEVGREFAGRLGRRLAALATRTLVRELHAAAGTLTGADSSARFADFVRKQSSPRTLALLLRTYPVLARLVTVTCDQAVEAEAELLARFCVDRPAILAELLDDTDPGALVAVGLSAGDSHQHGRSVAILRLASGAKVVYKPRSLALYRHFAELVEWLNANTNRVTLRTARTVAGAGYGWAEFIPYRPCDSLADVNQFYRNQGALLALLYALDATDAHCENLVACGDQPVLVDVETLFHPARPGAPETYADPAAQRLSSSVYRSALLPQLLIGRHGALDVSGMGGDSGATVPVDAVCWEDAGTDRMRLVRRAVKFRTAVNRPSFAGRQTEPADFRAPLLAGFRSGYETIVAGREDLLAPGGPLRRSGDDEIRVLARPTRLYSVLLDESTHPDLLRDALDRDRALDLLWADSADDDFRRRLVPHEHADLWAGDVPLFTGRPSARALWSADGACLPDLLDRPTLAHTLEKIEAMGEVDESFQEWVISAALATRPHSADPQFSRAVAKSAVARADPEYLLAAASTIADEVMGRAARGGGRGNWVGLEPADGRHWALLPMGAGLGYGYIGVALFLAELAKLTGLARGREIAREAVSAVPGLLDMLGHRPELAATAGHGGFLGLGGVCYGLARLASLLDDQDLHGWLATAVDVLAGLPDDGRYGVSGGLAGDLAALIAVAEETGLPAARRLTRAIADRLVAAERSGTGRDGEPAGFAHGSTGIGWALMRYAEMGAGEPYAAVGRAALRRGRKEVEKASAESNRDYGWCSGLSGTIAADLIDGDTADIRVLLDRAPRGDLSLRHGELGVLEPLTMLAAAGEETAAAGCAWRAGFVLAALRDRGACCGTPDSVPTPNLLSGLAGIGYGLLRLGFPKTVPSVLFLEAMPEKQEDREK